MGLKSLPTIKKPPSIPLTSKWAVEGHWRRVLKGGHLPPPWGPAWTTRTKSTVDAGVVAWWVGRAQAPGEGFRCTPSSDLEQSLRLYFLPVHTKAKVPTSLVIFDYMP